MSLKAFMEKRAGIIEKMEAITSKVEIEVRAFTEEETTDFTKLETEVRGLDTAIESIRATRAATIVTKVDNGGAKVGIKEELLSGKTINLEERAVTEGIATGGNVAIGGQVVHQTYADSIIKKLEYISPLYAAVNKIVTNSPFNIPLQGNKIGKFVKTAELGKILAQNADYVLKQLGAVKYTNMFTTSKELLDDSAYNIEADLIAQTTESLAITLDELVVTGDVADNVEGLNMLPINCEIVASGVKTVTENDLVDMFYSLPIQYRANATWLLSDATAKVLAKIKDAEGKPLLYTSYNADPVNGRTVILGRPVIINNFIADVAAATAGKFLFFGDLSKILTVGLRKNLEMTRSTEYLFDTDGIAIKSVARLDSKLMDTKVMKYMKSKIV